MTSSLYAWFWSESFWLPQNVSWADLEHPPPGVEYPRAGHILYALPMSVVVFILRLIFERYFISKGFVFYFVFAVCSCECRATSLWSRGSEPEVLKLGGVELLKQNCQHENINRCTILIHCALPLKPHTHTHGLKDKQPFG